ncbi:MAG: hypothetical protein NTX64_13100 [Elusimicrobia bacterium]|nr:hypothetical protein [Elusimicrobiota bacterium]
MRKYAGWCVVVVGAAVLAAGCHGPQAKVKEGQINRSMESQAIGKQYIEATGIGAADQNMTNQTQRMATSRNAAIAAAQHELLSLIKGVHLTGAITVEKAMETDSKILTTVDEVMKGAEITKQEWTKDDGCVVSMRIPKKTVATALGVAIP